MRRRDFIRGLGGAAATWPLAVRAQQDERRVRRIGVLVASPADDAESQARVAAFKEGLAQLGWTEGRNVRIDTRWATTNADDLRKHAAELAASTPDVLVGASGTTTVAALLGRFKRSLQHLYGGKLRWAIGNGIPNEQDGLYCVHQGGRQFHSARIVGGSGR